ncbi:unannotated protein [freshwater metagenome]|uniref:Unannotated protein n=1 Tax=freshwater metagenome TaxID=449393 RepID=A0A6J6WBK0_9ZZZZ|nr:hypothetical protein [Actinomycetota bacterium]MSW23050.1 hypothetical protein [Actinomycetota bacterium]MSW75257.1 hypothetical protein [Actinomycetota bacterium]MSY30614.1 hypothetical protein [Actinomycetota bacterium]
MLVHRVALTLRAGATLAFVAALALLAKPSAVASFVGFRAADITPGFLWALRALGLSMLVIAVLAPLIASFGGERGLRQTASAMAFSSLLGLVLAVISPSDWTVSKCALCAVIAFFMASYLFALRGRRRNR